MRRSDPLADMPAALQKPLRACAEGRLPPNVMLMQLVQACSNRAELEALLQQALGDGNLQPGQHGHLSQAQRIWEGTPQAWSILRSVLDVSTELDHMGATDIASWSAAFDRLAEISPDAGVALYSLGRSDLLYAATREIVDLMRAWDCLGRDKVLLEIGCGSGRFLESIAAESALVIGCDVSFGMLHAARSRYPAAILLRNSGRDLAALRDSCADVIYAVDVFPYLVAAGGDVAARHISDAGRVLRPDGQLLVFNYSYRNDAEADRAELEALTAAAGFAPLPATHAQLRYWDGAIFRFARRSFA